MKKQIQTAFMTALAARLSASVQKIDHRDPNVTNRLAGVGGEAFRESIRFLWNGIRTEIRFNGFFAVLESRVGLDAGVWSINHQDRIMMTSPPHGEPKMVDKLPIFVAIPASSRAYDIWQSKDFRYLLNSLNLGKSESLHFYRNAVTLYAEASDVSTFARRTEALSLFIQRYRRPEDKPNSLVTLPIDFQDLREVAQIWAISDDVIRTEKLDSSSAEDLQRLVDWVMPRINKINEHLSTHFDDESAILGALAEAASEAKLRLDRDSP